MLEGPKKFLKLPFQQSTHHLYAHYSLPFLLRTTSRSLFNYNLEKQQNVKQIMLEEEISKVEGITHSRGDLLHYTPNYLYINDKKLHVHQGKITKAIADDYGIVLTSGVDQSIKITSTKKHQILSQFMFHYSPISEMFWHNSLCISGDTSGEVCLWDVNLCRQFDHRKIHYQSIDFLGVFVDFTINNIFYTANKSEKRLVLSDLRTNRPIKIIANLHSDKIVDIKHTPSGKIFIVYDDIVDIVDLYDDYKIMGNFSPTVAQKKTQMKWTKSKFSLDNIRKITVAEIMGKHLVCGCSNGCIQVYDSDTYECIFGFGLCKFGPIRKMTINQNKQLYALDGQKQVYMAQF